MHEASGSQSPHFAAILAAQAGDALWARESWPSWMISPAALADYIDPARLLVTQTASQIDTLAVAEEALRDGCVPLVVIELTAPIGLTAGRRLQLAAKAGGSTGLCLISEKMGSPAAETRWRCTALPDPGSMPEDSTLQKWELIKNKSGTLGVWHVRWSQSARRLIVVSETSQ
ncbi:ImuA family protein [Paracoccus sediminicola]|uniref:ImuA family protein n=1 Tax=Paracoccus sediminicola TaxID=3017783 RepID=UPI00336AB64B